MAVLTFNKSFLKYDMKNRLSLRKSVEFLFIVAGTSIVTAKPPSVDRFIQTERESIGKCEDPRILG